MYIAWFPSCQRLLFWGLQSDPFSLHLFDTFLTAQLPSLFPAFPSPFFAKRTSVTTSLCTSRDPPFQGCQNGLMSRLEHSKSFGKTACHACTLGIASAPLSGE